MENNIPNAHLAQQELNMFWSNQRQIIDRATDFRNHQLPLARIKKIMKADEDVRMISAEAPVLFSKACELFILELTLRSWNNAQDNKRRTVQKSDIAAAIAGYQFFDFLVDIVPPGEEAPVSGGPWNYPQHPHSMGVMQQQPEMYHMLPSSAWQAVWENPEDDSYVPHGNGDGPRCCCLCSVLI